MDTVSHRIRVVALLFDALARRLSHDVLLDARSVIESSEAPEGEDALAMLDDIIERSRVGHH